MCTRSEYQVHSQLINQSLTFLIAQHRRPERDPVLNRQAHPLDPGSLNRPNLSAGVYKTSNRQ
jgi:hypothetical protein